MNARRGPQQLNSVRRAKPEKSKELTIAEFEVAHLYAQGCSMAAIAQRLAKSTHSVKTQMERVWHKLEIPIQPDRRQQLKEKLLELHTAAAWSNDLGDDE